ncbi:MAG: putative 2-aminoethylphosphonate ABC transporter substrate-binding protein [Dongiaceae bacterium]
MTHRVGRVFGALVIAAVGIAGLTAAKAEDLTVYTAFEDEQLAGYKAAFEAVNPDITINWVRDSTGVVTARLLAEKNNPQADVIWGLAATSLLVMDAEGMLQGYAPAGVEDLKPGFVDQSNDPPHWLGMDAYISAICFNTAEGAARNIPAPTGWADLLNPIYKNSIVMPNPGSSGTGFLTVSAILQQMGEEEGWKYLDGLHENINTYLHSGSKPCVAAAQGEYLIGISFEYRGVQEKNKGAPVDIIIPAEGAGWELEAGAIMAGTDQLDAAQHLMDFAISKEANVLYNQYFQVVGYPGITQEIPNYPANAEELMIENDFSWAALNRERILEEWQARYGSKDAPQ